MYFALRSLAYLAAILIGLAVSAWLVRASAESEPLIERGGIIFSLILSVGFNLLSGVSDLLGQGVLFNFVAGRYRRPRIEERVLLFIDMEGSTAVAERLGEAGFLDFLNRFIGDVTEFDRGAARRDPQICRRRDHRHLATRRRPCRRALRPRLLRRLEEIGRARRFLYSRLRPAGQFPRRAALRTGGHRRTRRRQNGDRVPRRHHEHGGAPARGLPRRRPAHPCFGRVGELLAALPPGIAKRSIGRLRLRGKENDTEIYALASAEVATRPSGEVTVLFLSVSLNKPPRC